MTILDRYLIRQFLANFIILFALIYLLATAIDVLLQLDEFIKAARAAAGDDGGPVRSVVAFVVLLVRYHGPRFFQLYAYLLGLTTVGAMGFTLAQLVRHRELVAILAAGASLFRVGWPIILTAFALNLLHLVNSNVVLPHFAPVLIRGHTDLRATEARAFEIPFTADSNGMLLQSPAFHRDTGVLERPIFLVRGEDGRTIRRINADAAEWNEARSAWMLLNGRALTPVGETGSDGNEDDRRDEVAFVVTDLSPRVLTVRRYRLFAQMLSGRQIEELIKSSSNVDKKTLARIKYSRFAVVLTNMLMLIMTLPFFLIRLPVPMLQRSVLCSGVAIAAMLGAFVGIEVDFVALGPAAGVFFPVIVLIPLALASACFIRT